MGTCVPTINVLSKTFLMKFSIFTDEKNHCIYCITPLLNINLLGTICSNRGTESTLMLLTNAAINLVLVLYMIVRLFETVYHNV